MGSAAAWQQVRLGSVSWLLLIVACWAAAAGVDAQLGGGAPTTTTTTTTVGYRVLGYTFTTDISPYVYGLSADDCAIIDLYTSGQGADVYKVYTLGDNAASDGLSYGNLTRATYPGDMYNDMIIDALGPTGINDAFYAGQWRYSWGALGMGVRTPLNTLMFAVKGKEMLHQWDLANGNVYELMVGNKTVLTGPGTHPFAAHYLDMAYSMWSGNASGSACPEATMAYTAAQMAVDMGTMYRGASLINYGMDDAHNSAQFYAKAVNADSLTVWDYSIEAASLLIEFGLQFTLRESFVMDFGKSCNASEVVDSGATSARDVLPFTVALLEGLAGNATIMQALGVPDGYNTTAALSAIGAYSAEVTSSSFSYSGTQAAMRRLISALPTELGLDYARLGSPPTTTLGSHAPGTPFWWLFSAFPNCTGSFGKK